MPEKSYSQEIHERVLTCRKEGRENEASSGIDETADIFSPFDKIDNKPEKLGTHNNKIKEKLLYTGLRLSLYKTHKLSINVELLCEKLGIERLSSNDKSN